MSGLTKCDCRIGTDEWLAPLTADELLAPLVDEASVPPQLVAWVGAKSKSVPALVDSGASLSNSCSRSLDGALLDTCDKTDAGGLPWLQALISPCSRRRWACCRICGFQCRFRCPGSRVGWQFWQC